VSSTFDALELSFNFPTGGALSPGDHNLPNTLGINKLNSKRIILSPNPATDRINLNGITFSNNLLFQIFDICGRLQLEGQITQVRGEIDVKELRNGVYILRIVEQGEVYCSKFEVHQ
jgi:hypothetical protein